MRIGFIELGGKNRETTGRSSKTGAKATVKASGMIPDMTPLYDAEQFEGLIQRERARADRAAARPARPAAPRRTPPAKGIGGSKVEDVWGATTDNREFSLVIFRPRTRADRAGLVDLLQSSVRTTDSVGVIDNRRLGVLLPDTSADNAVFFVKKVLSGAEANSVHLSHVVHTYPHTWPDDGSPIWQEPRRAGESATDHSLPRVEDRTERSVTEWSGPERSAAERTVPPSSVARHPASSENAFKGFVGWLRAAAFRGVNRRTVRA